MLILSVILSFVHFVEKVLHSFEISCEFFSVIISCVYGMHLSLSPPVTPDFPKILPVSLIPYSNLCTLILFCLVSHGI